jgi:hypothetical protein
MMDALYALAEVHQRLASEFQPLLQPKGCMFLVE